MFDESSEQYLLNVFKRDGNQFDEIPLIEPNEEINFNELFVDDKDDLLNLHHANFDVGIDLNDGEIEELYLGNGVFSNKYDTDEQKCRENVDGRSGKSDSEAGTIDINDNVKPIEIFYDAHIKVEEAGDDLEKVLHGVAHEKPTFLIDRSIIPSVARCEQAIELQDIEGLSVYDQDKLEAGILKQVDDALGLGVNKSVEEETSSSFNVNSIDENETEMERSIRLGEMTPFGTVLNSSSETSEREKKKRSEISVLEKYFKQQEKLSGPSNKISRKQNKDPLKRKVLNRDGRKKKPKKKEKLGTRTKYVSRNITPGPVPGESNYMYEDNATDSEYLPSESDLISSDDGEKPSTGKTAKKQTVRKQRKPKRKLNLASYKIPEDWRSDDSDWESSDEELKRKRRRSKQELDDGDPDLYRIRLEEWRENNEINNADSEKFHKFDGDYKIPHSIWDKLYNYQKVCVRWLWELDRQRCGGILGDEMGLGKTIQIIAFLVGLHYSEMKDKDTGYRGLGPSLIICPTTVMHQWVREFHTWFPHARVAILHESGTYTGKSRAGLIAKLHSSGSGFLVMSYTGAIQHKDDLISKVWHYTILDEGHKIRNPDAQVTLVVKQFKTSHRIILSGSPMQNNLRELWSLFDFIFPGKLGTLPVFLEQFDVPITQGGYANASEVQVVTAYKCATILKDTISPYLLRRMKADVMSHIKLPEKNEEVLFCKLTDEQRRLYKGYVESGEVDRILSGRTQIFMGLITLRKICNHPDLFSGGPKLFQGEKEEDMPEAERYGHWSKSGKMIVVQTLLKIWKKQGHRVLLFSQSQQMLCILESFVKQSGYKYMKLDGATSVSSRQPLINTFNQDTSYFVMLLTTRVGGLGVNLTGANRVVIYDPDWNPATDSQARERAWRIGQKQSVTVYRLITAGTIEEKMYHRQIFKQFLTNKVLKDPRQRRFFKSNDLFELFTLKETDKEGSTETSAIFAGTNSEVKLDPNKSYHSYMKSKPVLESSMEIEKPSVTFSKKKIEHMKKLAQQLSMSLNKKLTNAGASCTVTSGSSSENTQDKPESDYSVNEVAKVNVSSIKSEVTCDSKCGIESVNSGTLACNSKQSNTDVVNLGSSSCPSGSIKIIDNSTNVQSNDNSPSNVRFSEQNPGPGSKRLKIAHGERSKTTLPNSFKNSTNVDKKFCDKLKHKDKHKKHKRRNYMKFEGETVPHLVKQTAATNNRSEENDEAKQVATQDEYVLKKLFDKSGLQTAMKHDTIMEGGPSDYALVEGEADKVASKAVAALKESRRDCNHASSGLPTYTGNNGFLKRSKLQLGSKTTGKPIVSSQSILQKIKQRNLDSDPDSEEVELLRDMCQFVINQGGTTTTNKLVNEFKERLPVNKSAVFKSLLSKICVFYRAPDSCGYWTLRDEFM